MGKLPIGFLMLVAVFVAMAPALAIAFDFGGTVADEITLLGFGVIAIAFVLVKLWAKHFGKKGLDALGLSQFVPALDALIENLVIAVEEEARVQFKKTGVAMKGEEKFAKVLTQVDAFLEKFGIDLDNPIVKSFINAQVAKAREWILDELKQKSEGLEPK